MRLDMTDEGAYEVRQGISVLLSGDHVELGRCRHRQDIEGMEVWVYGGRVVLKSWRIGQNMVVT